MSISIVATRNTEGKHPRDEVDDFFLNGPNEINRIYDRRKAIPKRFEDRSFAQKRAHEDSDEDGVPRKRVEPILQHTSAQNGQDPMLNLCIRRLCYLHIETMDAAVAFVQKHMDDEVMSNMVRESAYYISYALQSQRWKIDDCVRIRLGNE